MSDYDIRVSDNPEIQEYKDSTATLDLQCYPCAPYSYTNDRLLVAAQGNPDSWLYKKIHNSTTVLASNHLVRNLNVTDTMMYFVKK